MKTLPAYKPSQPLSYRQDYAQGVSAYGEVPAGYRWLKVGEKIEKGDIWCDSWAWHEVEAGDVGVAVVKYDVPAARPVVRETITFRLLNPDEAIQIGDLYLSDPRYLDGRGPKFVVDYDSPSLGETVASTLLMGKFYRRTIA